MNKKINPETGKYFEKASEYEDYRIRQKINPETGKYFETTSEYRDYRFRQKINPETGKYFETTSEYCKFRSNKNRDKIINKLLSDLITGSLTDIGKNQSWLSKEIGVSREIISKYIQGKIFPKKDNLEKLEKVLNFSFKTLEELLKDN